MHTPVPDFTTKATEADALALIEKKRIDFDRVLPEDLDGTKAAMISHWVRNSRQAALQAMTRVNYSLVPFDGEYTPEDEAIVSDEGKVLKVPTTLEQQLKYKIVITNDHSHREAWTDGVFHSPKDGWFVRYLPPKEVGPNMKNGDI